MKNNKWSQNGLKIYDVALNGAFWTHKKSGVQISSKKWNSFLLIWDNFATAARPHTSTVFPLDRISAELGRSPAEIDHHQPPKRRHAAGELIYLSVSLARSRRPRSSSSCTCAERGGVVRSTLDRSGSWDGSRDGSRGGSRDVRTFHYINRVS